MRSIFIFLNLETSQLILSFGPVVEQYSMEVGCHKIVEMDAKMWIEKVEKGFVSIFSLISSVVNLAQFVPKKIWTIFLIGANREIE